MTDVLLFLALFSASLLVARDVGDVEVKELRGGKVRTYLLTIIFAAMGWAAYALFGVQGVVLLSVWILALVLAAMW